MATRTDVKTYCDKYFHVLFDYAYANAPKSVKKWIRENMIPNGDIAIESLLETAIAKQTGLTKYSSIGYDFLNKDGSPGGDAKKATVFENPNRPRREAKVTDFHNKTGDLYICVYEPLTDKLYYFRVPHWYYRTRTVMSVYFELDGSPRRDKLRSDSKEPIWIFECKSGIKGLLNG